MQFFDSLVGLVAVILIFGLPVIAVVMGVIMKMNKEKQQRELRQMIIENKVDAETAKLLIDDPKKKEPRKVGAINLDTLRTACIMLGIGLGALLNWILDRCVEHVDTIYFWLIIAFGIGIGLLAAFIVEIMLAKKYGKLQPKDSDNNDNNENN
ncbi:MAG: hypothetical protein J5621_07310 [Paludibacteraceae bacterium]|nr:hypothetical protein [Paludibacteraceae bacterium]